MNTTPGLVFDYFTPAGLLSFTAHFEELLETYAYMDGLNHVALRACMIYAAYCETVFHGQRSSVALAAGVYRLLLESDRHHRVCRSHPELQREWPCRIRFARGGGHAIRGRLEEIGNRLARGLVLGQCNVNIARSWALEHFYAVTTPEAFDAVVCNAAQNYELPGSVLDACRMATTDTFRRASCLMWAAGVLQLIEFEGGRKWR